MEQDSRRTDISFELLVETQRLYSFAQSEILGMVQTQKIQKNRLFRTWLPFDEMDAIIRILDGLDPVFPLVFRSNRTGGHVMRK